MSIPTLFRRHECKTLEEVNALALTDGQENGAYVISPDGELCWWYVPYAQRNEPTIEGEWSYQDGYGGSHIYFPLSANATVTVLAPEVPEEPEEPEYESEEDILKRMLKDAIREERVEYTQAQNRRAIDEEFLRSGVMLQMLQDRRRT